MFLIKSLKANLNVQEEFNDSSKNCFPRVSYNYERSLSDCGGISISSFKLYAAAYTDEMGFLINSASPRHQYCLTFFKSKNTMI